MNPGEAFEIECYKYLKEYYDGFSCYFERQGGMDSTISDIAVKKNDTILFYIEAKNSSAQSGQFVLLPDNDEKKFIFSPRNHSKPNDMTNIMIEYMNRDFELFNTAGTSGKKLDIDSEIFAEWIIGHYNERNVKYFISYNNGYVILPINKFSTYFDITAKYRIKKSGSKDPAIKDLPIIKSRIKELYPAATISRIEGDKMYIHMSSPFARDRFQLGEYTYFFSPQEDAGYYRIKRLSNTYHMNVIFSIHLKKRQDPIDLVQFESEIK